MNEKQGKHLDQRIRESLAGLPDGPPPGSSFDSARLWEQLRPELVAQPVVSKKRIGGWWLAAASVIGLLVGLWWFGTSLPLSDSASRGLKQTKEIKKEGIGHRNIDSRVQAKRSVKAPSHGWQAQDAITKRLFEGAGKHPLHRTNLSEGVASTESILTKQANGPDSSTEDNSGAQTAQPVQPESTSQSTIIAATKPTVVAAQKRRFRVVHENELMAEDEAHRVRYANEAHTERFVRLGTGSRTLLTPDQDSPGLTLPLNRKSTQ